MGNYKVMTIDTQYKSEVHSENTALKISCKNKYDWSGFGLVDPANDWGKYLEVIMCLEQKNYLLGESQ